MLGWQPLVSACCGVAGNSVVAVLEVHRSSQVHVAMTFSLFRRCKLLALSPVVRLV